MDADRMKRNWFVAICVAFALVLLVLGGKVLRRVDAFAAQNSRDMDGGEIYLPMAVKAFSNVECSAIQLSIDALPAEGGQVLVPAGIHVCTTAIVIDRDNVQLRGDGPASVLRLADHTNTPVIVIGSTAETPVPRRNIQVMDLAIDGNRLNQDYECWDSPCGSGGMAYIRNNGIAVRGAVDVLVENVNVKSTISGGLVAERGTRRLTVREFTAFDNHFDGLAAYETEYSTFSGLYLTNNCAAGLSFDLGFNHNMVSEVVISRDGTSTCAPGLADGSVGAFILNSRDNLFLGMRIDNMRTHGLFLADAGSPASAATGNTFTGLVISNSGWDADPATEGFCVSGFVGGTGMCLNNETLENNLVVGAQFSNNRGGCVVEATPALLTQSGVICR